jgi:electron transport complex protein RnfC
MPLTERIVTVDGDCITAPKNLKVPIGTPISAIIEYCGLKKEPRKIINGGPMMGMAVFDINMPVTKGTSAILVFSDRKINKVTSECIHCGRCVDGCPMHLSPAYLAMFAKKEDLEMCEKYDVFSCVECGCCTYICPGSVPIVQYIRTAKGRILENRQRASIIESAKKTSAPPADSKEYKGRAAAAGRKIETGESDKTDEKSAENKAEADNAKETDTTHDDKS